MKGIILLIIAIFLIGGASATAYNYISGLDVMAQTNMTEWNLPVPIIANASTQDYDNWRFSYEAFDGLTDNSSNHWGNATTGAGEYAWIDLGGNNNVTQFYFQQGNANQITNFTIYGSTTGATDRTHPLFDSGSKTIGQANYANITYNLSQANFYRYYIFYINTSATTSFRVSEIRFFNDSGGAAGASVNVTLNLIKPANGTVLSTDGTTFNVTCTIDSGIYNFTNITYYIWFTNGTIFNRTSVTTTVNNDTNASLFINSFVLGKNYLWNALFCWKNTSYSNCGFAPRNYTFINLPFTENIINFTPSIYETSYQNYSIFISTNPSVSSISGYLWYNETKYTTTLTSWGSGNYTALSSIDVPLQEANGNKSFYWEFNMILSDTSTLNANTSTQSQSVNRTIFTFCNVTYPVQFINFTVQSATNPFPNVDASFKSAWTYWLGTGTTKRNYTFEDVTETVNNFAFCASPNKTFNVDGSIEYSATDYMQNYYYLNDAGLTNVNQYISLFLLNASKAKVTTLKVLDEAQQPVEGVTIQIQVYDVGTGTFYTVGMAQSDFKGEDIVYLNWYDSSYKFTLTKDGEALLMTNTTKIGSSPVTFNIGTEITFAYEKFRDFVYSLYYNNNTQNFVLTFTKPSGLVDQGCLRVIKRTAKNDTQICLTCESSASATVYCNIAGYGNGTYIAHFYATGPWYDLDWITTTIGGSFATSIYEALGNDDGTFYAMIFAALVTFMMFVHPIFGILGLLLGIVGGSALGFTALDYGTFAGIAIVGGFIIWIIKR